MLDPSKPRLASEAKLLGRLTCRQAQRELPRSPAQSLVCPLVLQEAQEALRLPQAACLEPPQARQVAQVDHLQSLARPQVSDLQSIIDQLQHCAGY